jgi:phosphoserine phosphatase
MPRPDQAAPILVCDLDGTLVHVNTFPLFLRFLLGRLLTRRDAGGLATLGWALVRRKVLRGPHLHLKAATHRVGARLEPELVRSWADAVAQREVNPGVAALVRDWSGPSVLTTAAPGVYAGYFAERFGFTTAHASDFVAGAYVENVSGAKTARLAAAGLSDVACAVSDDAVTDAPLLAAARRALLVEPGGELVELPRVADPGAAAANRAES